MKINFAQPGCEKLNGQFNRSRREIFHDRRCPKFRPAHGGADFRQNFGQHTAAQIFAKISAITRRRRFFSVKFKFNLLKLNRKRKQKTKGNETKRKSAQPCAGRNFGENLRRRLLAEILAKLCAAV